MATLFYQPSTVACNDPLCELLKRKWLELVRDYYVALIINSAEFRKNPREAYLASLSPMDLITSVDSGLEKVTGIVEAVKLMPQRSPELEALLQEISAQLPSLDDQTGAWSLRLYNTINQLAQPGQQISGTLQELQLPILERQLIRPWERYVPNIYGPRQPIPPLDVPLGGWGPPMQLPE